VTVGRVCIDSGVVDEIGGRYGDTRPPASFGRRVVLALRSIKFDQQGRAPPEVVARGFCFRTKVQVYETRSKLVAHALENSSR
jgi:hypothetical protein